MGNYVSRGWKEMPNLSVHCISGLSLAWFGGLWLPRTPSEHTQTLWNIAVSFIADKPSREDRVGFYKLSNPHGDLCIYSF